MRRMPKYRPNEWTASVGRAHEASRGRSQAFFLAEETAPPLLTLYPFIHAASGRDILDELVKNTQRGGVACFLFWFFD